MFWLKDIVELESMLANTSVVKIDHQIRKLVEF